MSSRTAQKQGRHHRKAGVPAATTCAEPAGPVAGWAPVVVLVLVVLATFWRVCAHEFTYWDDDLNVTHNPLLFGQGPSRLLSLWEGPFGSARPKGPDPYYEEYIPLSYTTWWLLAKVARVDTPDAAGVSLDPYVFHIANLLLYLGTCLIAYQLLRRLTGRPWAACAGALLFALHPLHVEPVAWVTGLKDLLCGLLSLVALDQYVLFARPNPVVAEGASEQGRRWAWHYAAATLALAGAMFAKPAAVVVPLMAAAIDLWVLRRSFRRVVLALLPWAAIAAVFALVGLYAQSGISTGADADVTPILMRPLVVGDTLAFYLSKFLLPIGLAPIYPHSLKQVLSGWTVWVAWLVPAALVAVAWATRRRALWVAAAVAIFVAAPLPVSGLVPYHYDHVSTVADRYIYLGILGPALALAFVLGSDRVRGSRTARVAAGAACGILFTLLAGASFAQTGYWRDSATLFNRAMAVSPSDLACGILARDALTAGRREEALGYATQAVHLNPNRAQNFVTLGLILNRLGRYPEAGKAFLTAVQIDPHNIGAVMNLADMLMWAGQDQKAMVLCQGALQTWPNSPHPHRCMALLLSRRHQDADALREAAIAVKLDPADAATHVTLGQMLDRTGHHADAAAQFAIAEAISPHSTQGVRAAVVPAAPPSHQP